MRWIHFVDEELIQELSKLPDKKTEETELEEHQFIATCLQIGLTINDLKQMQFKDTMKIMICFMKNGEKNEGKNDGIRKATQSDIDK